ncbi:MAG: DUF366 family protein [Deltaproteobacteria bacterium]|nr:DUF366 family protein [Deltaproteobacteria bacterium]
MIIHFSNQELTYTGQELRPHFLFSHFDLKGSGICAFIGPCHVKTEHLVDWEDRKQGDFIKAKLMLHFLSEFFCMSLKEAVLLQRLFIAKIAEKLNFSKSSSHMIIRSGNDLFINERKLSVSIVTSSPVSQLLHIGVNLDPEGAPVSAIGLFELGLSISQLKERFIPEILEDFAKEFEGASFACTKVRPVI